MSYIDNEILERLIGTMVEGFARIEKKLDQMNRLKECMNGDRLLDNVIWLNCWVCRSVHWPVTGRRARSNIIPWRRTENPSIWPLKYRNSCSFAARGHN